MPLSPNLRGAIFMSVAMAGFTINDAITKLVSDSMNAGQIMLVRGVFATLLICLIAWRRGSLHSPLAVFHPMVILRLIGEVGGTVCFLIALFHMPIANLSAVFQALPLAVTMGAALVLSEPVGWRRWLAITVGFIGVTIVVRPGFEGFSIYTLFGLASVVFCAVRDIATRRIPADVPTLLVSAVTTAVITLTGAITVQPFGGWAALTFHSTALLAAAAVLILIGYQFVIESMRIGDISFSAPFRYTALLWAMMLGYTIFGDIPDGPMIVGSTIIIGSGLYALYRENAVRRRLAAAGAQNKDKE